MKSRSTSILLGVTVLVGGLVLLDYKHGTTTDDASEKRKKLLDFITADVTGIELIRSNQTIVVEKTGDQWIIKQPLTAHADTAAVNAILDELQFTQRQRTLTETDATGFGLSEPRLRLNVQAKKGGGTLLIGAKTPTGNSVYIQVEGEKSVSITDRAATERLDRSLDDLRDRTVLDFTPVTATRFEIKAAGHALEIAKSSSLTNAEPRWALVQPLAARADQMRVNQLLSQLSSLLIANFVSDNAKDVRTYKLDEPSREITVWKTAADLGTTLLLGQPLTNDASKIYAKVKGRDTIFTLPVETTKSLDASANDLRDHNVLGLESLANVRALDIQHGVTRVSVERSDTGWKLIAPFSFPAEEDEVQTLLDHLQELTVKQFSADVPVNLEAYGLALPGTIVTLKSDATNTVAQLLVGSLDATNAVRYVKRAIEPFVYGVETNLTNWLPATHLPLMSRNLTTLKPDQITKLVIEKPGNKLVLERGPDKNWKLTEPTTGILDTDGLRNFLDAFAGLRAEEYLLSTPDLAGKAGLDHPATIVTATVADKTYTLKLGVAHDPGSDYASWSDPDLLFTLAVSHAQTLKKDILKSVAPPPSP